MSSGESPPSCPIIAKEKEPKNKKMQPLHRPAFETLVECETMAMEAKEDLVKKKIETERLKQDTERMQQAKLMLEQEKLHLELALLKQKVQPVNTPRYQQL